MVPDQTGHFITLSIIGHNSLDVGKSALNTV